VESEREGNKDRAMMADIWSEQGCTKDNWSLPFNN